MDRIKPKDIKEYCEKMAELFRQRGQTPITSSALFDPKFHEHVAEGLNSGDAQGRYRQAPAQLLEHIDKSEDNLIAKYTRKYSKSYRESHIDGDTTPRRTAAIPHDREETGRTVFTYLLECISNPSEAEYPVPKHASKLMAMANTEGERCTLLLWLLCTEEGQSYGRKVSEGATRNWLDSLYQRNKGRSQNSNPTEHLPLSGSDKDAYHSRLVGEEHNNEFDEMLDRDNYLLHIQQLAELETPEFARIVHIMTMYRDAIVTKSKCDEMLSSVGTTYEAARKRIYRFSLEHPEYADNLKNSEL